MITPRLKAYPPPVPAGESVVPGTSHWFMLQMIGSGRRVLEFGCASGYMSAHMKAAGCHVTGIEIDAEAAALARESCDEVVVADLDFVHLAEIVPDLAYDVLVFGDVLEHLRDPWSVLDEARRFIAPGGFAVISIPNVAHGSVRLKLLQGDFDYSELGILDDTHLRFFTLRTVEELCLRTGYRIETIERTKVGFFQETPLTPSAREMLFDPELIEQIRRDPEHDTLQFVLRVTPLSDDEKFEALAKELASARDLLRGAETSARLAQEALEEAEAEIEARERASYEPANDVARRPIVTIEDGDSRRFPPTRPTRGKTMSARAIKRAESLAAATALVEIDLAAAEMRNAELEESLRELSLANEALRLRILDPGETLRNRLTAADRENERLSDALRALQEDYAAIQAAHRNCVETESAKFREEMTFAVRRFLRYAEAELQSVQDRISAIDSAIAAIQSSKLWSIKRMLGKFRR